MKIVTTYSTTTPESAEQGEHADSGWHDEEGVMFDDVQLAIDWLEDNHAAHASSSHFHPGVWYSTEPEQDYSTGENITRSYHLKNFSVFDQLVVWAAITKQHMRYAYITRTEVQYDADPVTGSDIETSYQEDPEVFDGTEAAKDWLVERSAVFSPLRGEPLRGEPRNRFHINDSDLDPYTHCAKVFLRCEMHGFNDPELEYIRDNLGQG